MHQSQTHGGGFVVGPHVTTEAVAHHFRIVLVRTALDHTLVTLRWAAGIHLTGRGVETEIVFAPLGDITRHVLQSEDIGLIGSAGGCGRTSVGNIPQVGLT